MSFSELGLSDALIRAVAEHGYTQPTPIQVKAIPAVLAGGDLLAGAQTGTGKTAGFVLPMLQLLAARTPAAQHATVVHGKPAPKQFRRPLRALILTPTRELTAQVEASVQVYGKYAELTSTAVFGGVGIQPQISRLKHGVDILVATTGRLLDLHQQHAVDLSRVEILVLDEADRMLDMGFIPDIRRILNMLPKVRQNLLFSATFSDEIRALADGMLNAPAMIDVAPRNSTVEIIQQKVYPVDRERKRELLTHLIRSNNWFQVLVFTRTKSGANKLAEQLNRDGINALAIHGNKGQGARTHALAQFKDAKLQVLVATDIAARGIDIDQLPHVVNFDLPNVPEDYVHRIGRTGRAGATGEAISLACIDEKVFLADIEKLLGRSLPREVIPGFEVDPSVQAVPIQRRQQGKQQPGRGGRQAQPRNGNGAAGRGGQRPPAQGGAYAGQRAPKGGEQRRPGKGGAARGNAQGAQKAAEEVGQFAAAVARGDPMVSAHDAHRDGNRGGGPAPRGKDVNGNTFATRPAAQHPTNRRGR
jgi:ATP-dependent RNA helicase RhlE